MRALETLGGLLVALAIGMGSFRIAMVVLRGALKSKLDEEKKDG